MSCGEHRILHLTTSSIVEVLKLKRSQS